MKSITKIEKTILPWIEQYNLAFKLSDPKSKRWLARCSQDDLIYSAMKLGCFDLLAKFNIHANDPSDSLKQALVKELPGEASKRLTEICEYYPKMVSKLQKIKPYGR